MALGSEADWESIVSYGRLWSGHTGPQIACMFISHGLLDQFGDETPITGAKGPYSLGLSLSLH
jgi:hypothetical protein